MYETSPYLFLAIKYSSFMKELRPNTHYMKREGMIFRGDDIGPSSSPIVGKKMMN